MLKKWSETLSSYLHPVNDIIDVSQEVLGQHQPQPRLALHWLVHINVNVHGPIALKQRNWLSDREKKILCWIKNHLQLSYPSAGCDSGIPGIFSHARHHLLHWHLKVGKWEHRSDKSLHEITFLESFSTSLAEVVMQGGEQKREHNNTVRT